MIWGAFLLLATLAAAALAVAFVGSGRVWTRLGGLVAAAVLLIVALGLYWLPSPRAIAALEADRGPAGIAAPPLSCDQAEAAVPLLGRVSGGRVAMSESGELRIDFAIWGAMSESQRGELVEVVARARECATGRAPPSLRVLDVDSGEVLHVQQGRAGRR